MSETFVDVQQDPMAPPDTWPTLSYNRLLETKTQLMNKIYLARGKPMYLRPLNAALERLDALIVQKLNDPRGLS